MSETSLSLSELNCAVKNAIRAHLPDTYWLRAETSDVRQNQSGHCYLEFVEKDGKGQTIVARARGVIWSNTFDMLSSYFEAETGQQFASGLRVLVRVSVEFHELYGYSLSVVDIDPSFTIGEIARNRQLILKQLEDEGVLTLNKELPLVELANRIAVISSPTAAGYEDFCDQLDKNNGGFVFYTKLFPAIMQGERTEASIISALERIYAVRHLFDAVAIIRGGGATSELSSFDSYLIATNCAQFPLPIVSGIGHERDVTVVDAVAHTRAKTPTAVAEFFTAHLSAAAHNLLALQDRLVAETDNRLQKEKTALVMRSKDTVHQSEKFISGASTDIVWQTKRLLHAIALKIEKEKHSLQQHGNFIAMVSPENILKRGYSLTLKNGSIVKSAHELFDGDALETLFADGQVFSRVDKPHHP